MQLKGSEKDGRRWEYSSFSQPVFQANASLSHARPQWMRRKITDWLSEANHLPHSIKYRADRTGTTTGHIKSDLTKELFLNNPWLSIFDQEPHIKCYINSRVNDVWVHLSYPGGRRRSRVEPACCSTWPRTRRSWWGWRPPSPRPASPHRRPACASCSVCRRRNINQGGMLPWGGVLEEFITLLKIIIYAHLSASAILSSI